MDKQTVEIWTEGPVRRRVMTFEERMMLGYVDCILRRRAASGGMTGGRVCYAQVLTAGTADGDHWTIDARVSALLPLA